MSALTTRHANRDTAPPTPAPLTPALTPPTQQCSCSVHVRPASPGHTPHRTRPARPGQQAADAPYYRQVLHDLIDMGTDLARLLHQQASAQAAQRTTPPSAPQSPAPQPAPPPAPDALIPDPLVSTAAAFDRIARAVRRSIALARSLAAPVPPARDPAQHRAAARKRILREVEDAIQRTAPASGQTAPSHAAPNGSDADASDAADDSAEALTAELHDRLDAPDLDDDISRRPIADIITEICRDLGLAALSGAHPWKRRTPKDLEQLHARAAAPSSPRHPGAGSHRVPATPQRTPTNPVPPGPAAISRAATPTHADSAPPDDPAKPPATIATIPRHPKHLRVQWRPPPDSKQTPGGPHS